MTCSLSPVAIQPETVLQGNTAFSGHKVILHKDDCHPVSYVAVVLRRVVPLEEGECTVIATKAWTDGTAVVIVCPLEVAEYYQEQLRRYSLEVTIE